MIGGENQQTAQEKGTWSYNPGGTTATDAPKTGSEDAVEWTASEFIAHDKTPLWFIVVGILGVALSAALYLFTRDVISVIAVAILVIIFGVTGARKPRIVNYRLDRGGITIGRQFHPYGNFKSFAVVDEGAFASITMLPAKRFALPLSLYFSPEDEHKVLDALSNRLPLEPGQLSILDHLMRNLHF